MNPRGHSRELLGGTFWGVHVGRYGPCPPSLEGRAVRRVCAVFPPPRNRLLSAGNRLRLSVVGGFAFLALQAVFGEGSATWRGCRCAWFGGIFFFLHQFLFLNLKENILCGEGFYLRSDLSFSSGILKYGNCVLL